MAVRRGSKAPKSVTAGSEASRTSPSNRSTSGRSTVSTAGHPSTENDPAAASRGSEIVRSAGQSVSATAPTVSISGNSHEAVSASSS